MSIDPYVVDFHPKKRMHYVINMENKIVEGAWNQFFGDWYEMNRDMTQRIT